MNIVFRETVSGESIVENFPTGREVIIQTDADLSVAFWNPAAREYSTALPVSAPQAVLVCPSAKAKITTATTADVNVVLSVSPTADVVKTVSQTLTDPQKITAQKNIALSGTGDPNGSGLAASFTVSGDLTDGTNPITVPQLDPVAGAPGNWTATGLPNTGEGIEFILYKIEGQDGYEFLVTEDSVAVAGWATVSNAATPDLTDGWLPNGAETGTPVFTSSGPALLADPGTEYRQLSDPTGDLTAKWICRSDGAWDRLDIDATNAAAVAALIVTPATVGSAVEAMDADGKEAVRAAMGFNGTQTISGAKTFSGQVELTGQAATNPTSAMNRDMAAAMFAISPRVHNFLPFTTGTVTGVGSGIGTGYSGASLITIGNTADASARVKLTEDFGFADANAGLTFGFAMPFMLRVPLSFSALDSNGSFVIRVYACTQGTMTLPAAGSDPYPANTRGLCAEFRQKSTGTGWEARLCARDGHASSAGTFAASSWVEVSSNNTSKHYDVLITSSGTGSAKLFVTAYTASAGEYPASAATTPVCSLSGAGVPSTNASVATFWTRPEVAVIGDGVATTGAARYVKIFPCTAVYGSHL